MSELRAFLERPLVMMAVGVIILLFALNALSGGGFGIIIGLLLAFVGGNSLWRGFTKWQAGHS